MDGPRACRESEFDEVVSLINRVFRDGTGQDVRTDYPLVFDRSKLEYIRIIKVDGKVVSQVPLAPREVAAIDDTFMIGIIGPTVTHPDYRRRGYATICLRDCIGIMEEKGWPISVLWTREETFPFYQNSDFEAVSSQGRMYPLYTGEHNLFEPKPFDIVRYDAANVQHLESIMKIHNAEPYRITRSHAEYQMLFVLPKTSTFLAVKDRQVTAYLMLGEGINKPGLLEGGGSMEALESLVRHVLVEQTSGRQIHTLVPLTETSLGRLLESKKPGYERPIEEAMGVGYQMMRINSLDKLLRKIKNFMRRKSGNLDGDVCLICKETDETVTLKFHNGDVQISNEQLPETVVLTRRQLVQLIFGLYPKAEPVKFDTRTAGILERIFPFYFPIWELDHC